MFDGINAFRNYVVGRLAPQYVHSHRSPRVVRFVHGGADFFQRIMIRAVVSDKLDQIGAVENVFADRLTNLFRAVRIVVFE